MNDTKQTAEMKEQRRQSSRRSFKPRKVFSPSPEPFENGRLMQQSQQPKEPKKQQPPPLPSKTKPSPATIMTAAPEINGGGGEEFKQQEAATAEVELDYVDVMSREEQRRQLVRIDESEFRLPKRYLRSTAANGNEDALSSSASISTSMGSDGEEDEREKLNGGGDAHAAAVILLTAAAAQLPPPLPSPLPSAANGGFEAFALDAKNFQPQVGQPDAESLAILEKYNKEGVEKEKEAVVVTPPLPKKKSKQLKATTNPSPHQAVAAPSGGVRPHRQSKSKINFTAMLKYRGILPKSVKDSTEGTAAAVVAVEKAEAVTVTPPLPTTTMDQQQAEPSTNEQESTPAPAPAPVGGRPQRQRHRSSALSGDFYYPAAKSTKSLVTIQPPTTTTANGAAAGESEEAAMEAELAKALNLTREQFRQEISISLSTERRTLKDEEEGGDGQLEHPVDPPQPQPQPLNIPSTTPTASLSEGRPRRSIRPSVNPDEYYYPEAIQKTLHHTNFHKAQGSTTTTTLGQRRQRGAPSIDRLPNLSTSNFTVDIDPLSLPLPFTPTSPAFTPLQQPLHPLHPQQPQYYPVYGFATTAATPDEQQQLGSKDFGERMRKRKLLNPMAIGLVDESSATPAADAKRCRHDTTNDYFYREILVKTSTDDASAWDQEAIDECPLVVDSEQQTVEMEMDEVLVSNPADACAEDIVRALPARVGEAEGDGDPLEALIRRVPVDFPQPPPLNGEVREHLFTLLRFIPRQRLADLCSMGVAGGASLFFAKSMENANRLRDSLKLYTKQRLQSFCRAHCWLLAHLPVEILASYLNLIRFLKAAGSSLSDYVVKRCNEKGFETANSLIRAFLAPKVYDPPTSSMSRLMDFQPLRNVSLVLVYPQISTPYYHHNVKPHESLFRSLPRIAQCVEKVELNLDVDYQMSIEEVTWRCVHLIQKRVREIVERRPGDHIFLAGWGTSAVLNHLALREVGGVSGVLDLAFPTETAAGPRGDVEDADLCLTYCPTLFVVGENAVDANLHTMHNMRANMIVDNGLIVVGSASHNLFVSQLRLAIERVSQKCVERAIVEQVVEFVKKVVADLGPAKEAREFLRPIELPNPYEVDAGALRCNRPPPGGGSGGGGGGGGGGGSQSTTGGGARQRKKDQQATPGIKQAIVQAFENPTNASPLSPTLKSLHITTASSSTGQATGVHAPASFHHPPPSPLPLPLTGTSTISTANQGPRLASPQSIPSTPFGGPNTHSTIFSARNSLSHQLKKVEQIRIPTPSMLNQQLLPQMEQQQHQHEGGSSQQQREEEEAAAAAILSQLID